MPHCTSSKISAAPCSSHAARAAARASSASTLTPVSPWIGSSSTAAVRSSTAPDSAAAGNRDPAQEVEVLDAVLVPQPGPEAAHESDRLAGVGGCDAGALECLQLCERRARRHPGAHAAASILVPMPASVNSSSSSE